MTRSAFIEAYMPAQEKYFRMARRLLTSTEEAQDAVQEVLGKLWSRKNKLDKIQNKEAYGMMMIKNYCLDRLKSGQASNLTLIHSNYEEKGVGLEKQTHLRESVQLVAKLMEELPESQKMIMQMRDIEQYSYDEIGDIMDMQPTAIRVALSRARKTIREKLTQTYNYGIG